MTEIAIQFSLFGGLLLALGLGGLLTVFQMPGTWFMLLAAMGYSWSSQLPTWILVAMGLIAALAEVAEMGAGMKGAQKAGATRGAAWGALIGGFCGMLVFTPLIPVPILGSILGGLIGCAAGAFIVEHNAHGDLAKGSRVGAGAAIGRLVGLLIKMFAAFMMAGLAVGSAAMNLSVLFN